MSNTRTIFIIEESAVVRKVLKHHLEQLGFDTQEFAQAKAALIALESDMPRAILIDCVTLELEGFALIAKIRALEKGKTPFILMLHYEYNVDMLAKGLHLGADDFLLKPFDFEHIKEKIEKL